MRSGEGRELPRDGGLTSLVAGTVMMGLFLASREARTEGGAGGLRGEDTGGDKVGVMGGWIAGGSVPFLCSSSLRLSFLEVMVMDCTVDR